MTESLDDLPPIVRALRDVCAAMGKLDDDHARRRVLLAVSILYGIDTSELQTYDLTRVDTDEREQPGDKT